MDNLQQAGSSNGSSLSTTLGDAQAAPKNRFRFRKCSHLRLQKDFERVYAQKAAYNDGTVLAYVGFNDQGRLRIGMSVGKKVGNAVKRNRWKRLLREAFRLQEREMTQELINKLKRAKTARILEIQKREKSAAKAGIVAANAGKYVPETLCANPETSVANPETSVAKSETSVAKSETSVAKSETSVAHITVVATPNSLPRLPDFLAFQEGAAHSVQQIEAIAIPESAEELGIDIIAIPRAVIRPTLQMVKKSLRYSVKRAVVKLYGFEPPKREKQGER